MSFNHFWNASLAQAAVALAAVVLSNAASLAETSFPETKPSAQGLSEHAVALLDEHLAQLVKNQEIVGGEVHVIKNRHTVLHKSYGWSDREEKRQLQTDSLFCVRSMTKPVIGTAIQLLLEEGEIRLEQPVSEILPVFKHDAHQRITIQHLLEHRSGLPFTIFDGPLSEYDTILDVAQKAANTQLDFEPGSSFQYSDAGTDTLGAVLQTVSGKSIGAYVRERILEPLGMHDSYTLLEDVPDRTRVPSAYSGSSGNWEKHWKASDDPILPIFLGSQGLYCTTTDYARFLALWLDETSDLPTPLTPAAKERSLAPGSRIPGYPVGFSNLQLTYGQQWMVYHTKNSPELKVFGHNGSDGTYAWAWPEEDLIVLLFTQSRGTTVGMELEPTLEKLLLDQDVEGFLKDRAARAKAQTELARYVGIYWDEDVEDAYYVASLENNQLYFERPGKFRALAKSLPEEGAFQVGGSLKFQFETDETPAPAVLMTTSARTERQVRFVADESLPSIQEIAELVRSAYGIDQLKDIGVLKLSGKLKSGPLGLSSSITQWLDSRRSEFRVKSWASNAAVVTNGAEAAATSASGKLSMLEGASRLQEVAAHPSIQYGHWDQFYDKIYVMRQVEREGHTFYVVRAEVEGLPGKTILVDAHSGRIVAEQSLQFLPGAGYLGAITTYKDFREISGVTLPFHVETKLSNALLGKVVIQLESAEVARDVEGLFQLPNN